MTGGGRSVVETVGVVVPAHDEEDLIGACLDALAGAAAHPELAGVRTRILVVLDSCRDATGPRCDARAVQTLAIQARNVGHARRTGFAALIDRTAGAASGVSGLWLATTDADTRVAPDWLAAQLRLARAGADAVFGIIDVDDWAEVPADVPQRFAALYAGPGGLDGPHDHVHGASMGLRARTYLRAGGMPALALGEDRLLAVRLAALPGVQVARTTTVRATTSSRLVSRLRGGFADYLRDLAEKPVGVEPLTQTGLVRSARSSLRRISMRP